MSTPTAESEDVNDFLQRIKELGDKRDQEDEERNRKLEEEILQGRKERQARRAERARSISPTKSSPANTPTSSRVSESQAKAISQSLSPTIGATGAPEPPRELASDNAMDRSTGVSTSPTKENSSPFDSGRITSDMDLKYSVGSKTSPSNAMPSRNSPLSWQRRPASQASEHPRSRPLSMVATENAARSPRDTPEPASATEATFSRGQIVQNLASKDPAWFRQTADRGLNSPAYRKNQVEDEDRLDHGSSSAKVQMPGMLREGSMGQTSPEESSSRSSSPTRRNTESRATYQSSSGLGSPMPLTSAQKLDPPNESRPDARSLAMSPSQGRISPERLERPASPTKGMGGFVQSAMMKRSDSVNKRWSVQSPPGLSRGNSMAGNRNSADPGSSFGLGNSLGPTGSVRDSKSTSLNRETSPPPSSRPVSSHSNITATQEHPGAAGSIRSSMTPSTSTMDGSMKGSLPIATIQTSIGLNTAQDEHPSDPSPPKGETTPPTSPSKVMDARRWSPTKASWLESALNKPESPKPKSVAPPQQPAWMSEINKAKQKTSVDLGRTSSTAPKHEVNIGGLMRSPPPGGIVKPISIGGLPAGFSPGPNSRSRPEGASNTSRDSSKPAESSDMPTLSPLSSMISTTGSKVKPETPPKKDFRAGLKPRQPSSDTSGVSEPEFKNVFGQLRRTKTQNYVAPDELKDNITRGKAALNLTGGPKKTERRDEFKEAILKKKDDFKKAQSEGKGVTRSTSSAGQDVPLPEALAKRRALGRSDSITTASSSGISDSPSSQRIAPDSPKPSQVQETSSFGRLQAKEPPVSKLAGRLNPGLANLLARGPPSSDKPRSSSPASTQRADNISASSAEALEAGPQLTHMTKGRARGPRRKAPTSTSVTTNAPSNSVDQLIVKPVGRADPDPVAEESTGIKASSPIKDTVQKLPAPADTENEVSQPTSPRKLDLKRRSQFLQEAPNKNSRAESQLGSPKPLSPTKKANSFEVPVRSPETQSEAVFLPSPKPKPNTPAKSPSLSSKTSSITSPKDSPGVARPRQSPLSPTKPTISGKADEMPSFRRAFPPETHISGDQDDYEPIHFEVESTSVKTVAALWNRPSGTNVTQNIPRVSSPIKLPTHEDEKAALVGAGLRSPSPVRGKAPAGLQIQGAPSPRPLPIPPSRGIKSPPLSAGLSPSTDPSSAISDFFSSRRSSKDFRVDTATLLATRPPQGENIKTLRSSLYQLSSDGKKQMVPSHQERILFEGNLYLCIHTYGDATGKKVTEVYFWQGDDVPRKTVDQVKVFAQKEAKAAGGRFVAIAQGKETPEFFSALGGIIIIRRGSSNKYDSLAPHILCCRKYFGQIVFDEVDFSPASLCSGFPYLISTRTGNSYLWKGKGSGIEELSCARLIGMDFGLTGEVEEVDDGNETPAFLKAFDDAAIPKSADHWRMKPNYSKYCTRLYRADSSIKEQIMELNPFCQTDLDWSKIYILDAFFEIYIIVGSTAQAEFTSFQHALLFAQEYGILAAGMEDRPFVPVTTVILEGVPKDMRSVFRKWVPELSPTTHALPPAGSLQRGRSLRVLPLNAALDATRN